MILLTYMYTKADLPPPPPSISFGKILVLDEVGAIVKSCTRQWRIQGSPPTLFLDPTEARRAEVTLFLRPSPAYLRVWMITPRPPPPLI